MPVIKSTQCPWKTQGIYKRQETSCKVVDFTSRFEGLGLCFRLERSHTERFEEGQMNYAEAEMSSAQKGFQLGSWEKTIHLSSFSFTQLGFFSFNSYVKEKHQINEFLSAMPFS